MTAHDRALARKRLDDWRALKEFIQPAEGNA